VSTYSNLTRRAQVRNGFTEECVWRPALGDAEPLHIFITDGPLDAPTWMPAGSTIGRTLGGPAAAVVERPYEWGC
jgi:hypothetical protein